MPNNFHLERRSKAAYSQFFPDPLTKERQIWHQSTIGGHGNWTKWRFIRGDLLTLMTRVNAIAGEYDLTRMRNPNIDLLRLFESLPTLTPGSLEYWDYTGRITSISREALLVYNRDGTTFSPDRNFAVGFRGIIVKTSEPWDRDAFVMDALVRSRVAALLRGVTLPSGLTSIEPYRLRDALEREIRDMLRVAWVAYVTTPTPDNFDAVIGVERSIHSYILETLSAIADNGQWEFIRPLPFPDANSAISLWNQDKIDMLDYNHTAPWYLSQPKVAEKQVTLLRKAEISHKTFMMTITTNPHVYVMNHPQANVQHQLYSYGPPVRTGVAVPNPRPGFDRQRDPFIGTNGQGNSAWLGNIREQDGWSVIKDSSQIPEPTLSVRTRVIPVSGKMMERMEAASIDKFRPSLLFERLNYATAPQVYLPDLYVDVQVSPLFTSGWTLSPLEEGNSVSGWAIERTGGPGYTQFVHPRPGGFMATPASGRPIRVGSLTEILPY